jgi:hypothetical protein
LEFFCAAFVRFSLKSVIKVLDIFLPFYHN